MYFKDDNFIDLFKNKFKISVLFKKKYFPLRYIKHREKYFLLKVKNYIALAAAIAVFKVSSLSGDNFFSLLIVGNSVETEALI